MCGAAGARPPPPPPGRERGRGVPLSCRERGRERPRSCHSQPVTARERGWGGGGELWDLGVRDPEEGPREGDIKRTRRDDVGWQRARKDGEGLASDPGVRVPRHRAQQEASAQRRAAEREGIPGGRGRRSQHRLPRHRSSRGWEVLTLDGYGRGEGGLPQSAPTETSGLLGLGDPRAKRGDSKDSNGDGLSSHSAASGFREKDPTRGWCFDEGNGW